MNLRQVERDKRAQIVLQRAAETLSELAISYGYREAPPAAYHAHVERQIRAALEGAIFDEFFSRHVDSLEEWQQHVREAAA